MADLKLSKLPDRTPVKLTISLTPDLHALLGDYLSAYRAAYDDKNVSIVDIIPPIIARFIESDRAFVKTRRSLSAKV